ncbi:MAG: hypothetical protein GF393_09895, partial [Armatimonadia bacterium]|nr:hypothetical protein [Armatimonadia bacterium]
MRPEMNDISRVLGAIERREAPKGLDGRIMSACREAEPVEAISCGECLELASAYLDDELAPPTRESFEAHVFACDDCYVAFKQMERTAEVLRGTSAAPVPADLHERITAAVAREAGAESVLTWRRAAKVLGGLAAAAALLAAVFVPRGTDAPDATRPVMADLPAETSAEVTTETGSVTDPIASDEDAPEPAEATEEANDGAPAPSRIVAAPRAIVSSPSRERVASPAPEPARAAVAPDAAHSADVTPATEPAGGETQPRRADVERTEPSTPTRAATETRPRPEPATPAPRPAREPVTADDAPQPVPAHDSEPVTASAPTATRTSAVSAPKPDPTDQP